MDETWWKLILPVSRTFLNSPGTKIIARNLKKLKFKISKKKQKNEYYFFSVTAFSSCAGFLPSDLDQTSAKMTPSVSRTFLDRSEPSVSIRKLEQIRKPNSENQENHPSASWQCLFPISSYIFLRFSYIFVPCSY